MPFRRQELWKTFIINFETAAKKGVCSRRSKSVKEQAQIFFIISFMGLQALLVVKVTHDGSNRYSYEKVVLELRQKKQTPIWTIEMHYCTVECA